jgi:hypothetical protein
MLEQSIMFLSSEQPLGFYPMLDKVIEKVKTPYAVSITNFKKITEEEYYELVTQ